MGNLDVILKAVEKMKEMGCDEILIMPKNGMKAWDENGVEYTMMPSAQPEQRWIPCSEPPKKDGVYIVYAPNYSGGSSSAKEWHDGVMFSNYKKGKWSIEHGYYKRPNCAKAWMPLPEPWKGEDNETD